MKKFIFPKWLLYTVVIICEVLGSLASMDIVKREVTA